MTTQYEPDPLDDEWDKMAHTATEYRAEIRQLRERCWRYAKELEELRERVEPVAMRYDGDGYGYLYIDSGSGSDWQRRHKDAEPLYLAPPKPDAKREPATDEQVTEAYIKPDIDGRWRDFELGFRAAERFHGIRKEDK